MASGVGVDRGRARRAGVVAARGLLLMAVGFACANCSGPQATANRRGGVDPKYGVAASPRLYGEDDVIPKGGGRAMVGKPYVVAGQTYVPREDPRGYRREGLASWYGTAFHGRLTANGEVFDRTSVAAAHPTLPLPSYARVTNLANGYSMVVRVNDRGPYHEGRLMDVSQGVAEALDFRRAGTARVRVEYVGKASVRGSDDARLMATLRTDGRAAPLPGRSVVEVADLDEEGAFSRAAAAMRGAVAPTPAPAAPQDSPRDALQEPPREATSPVATEVVAPVTAEAVAPAEPSARSTSRPVRRPAEPAIFAEMADEDARPVAPRPVPLRTVPPRTVVAHAAPTAAMTVDAKSGRAETVRAKSVRVEAVRVEAVRVEAARAKPIVDPAVARSVVAKSAVAAARPAPAPPLSLSGPPLRIANATPLPPGRPRAGAPAASRPAQATRLPPQRPARVAGVL